MSAFGLFVVGAIASVPSVLRQQSQYSLSLPVPVRAAKVVKNLYRSTDRSRVAFAHRGAPAWLDDLSGSRFDMADEPYVVRAMQTGEFQEWLGSDGQRRFLNAGPEQADGDRRCRDLALLIRQSDGSSRTRTARRCAPQVSERALVATARVESAGLAVSNSDVLPSDSKPLVVENSTYADAEKMDRGITADR